MGVCVPLRHFCVQSALPGLLDQQEIAAALRQCNYDPEEVVSVFLTMFGEILLQTPPSRDPTYSDLNSFRSVVKPDPNNAKPAKNVVTF